MQPAQVQRLSTEYKKDATQGPLRTPKKDRKVTYRTNRSVKNNDFVRSAIRRKVNSFILHNIPPTVSEMLEKVNDDEELPNFKRTTVYTLMKEIGFNYEKNKKRALLIERNII
jgi:translation initiation factor 2 beta subunit (eIF-2beta)/eIF-5